MKPKMHGAVGSTHEVRCCVLHRYTSMHKWELEWRGEGVGDTALQSRDDRTVQ